MCPLTAACMLAKPAAVAAPALVSPEHIRPSGVGDRGANRVCWGIDGAGCGVIRRRRPRGRDPGPGWGALQPVHGEGNALKRGPARGADVHQPHFLVDGPTGGCWVHLGLQGSYKQRRHEAGRIEIELPAATKVRWR